jgi:hypothetical protein
MDLGNGKIIEAQETARTSWSSPSTATGPGTQSPSVAYLSTRTGLTGHHQGTTFTEKFSAATTLF